MKKAVVSIIGGAALLTVAYIVVMRDEIRERRNPVQMKWSPYDGKQYYDITKLQEP